MGAERAADLEIVRISRAQNGNVTWRQLLGAGLTPDAVRARVARGQLHRLHRQVYAVSDPTLTPLARESAAVLALGDGALISHRSAAALWSLAELEGRTVDVMLVGRSCRARAGIRLHRVTWLDQRDVRTRAHLPVTAPARTLVDFASSARPAELEMAVAEARVRGLVREAELRSALERAPSNHPGRRRISVLLEIERGPALTRSEAERKLLALVRSAQLPTPEANAPLHGYEVDFLWRRSRLVVEVDGHAYHASHAAFERDRRRDRVLTAAGLQVMRVTWRQLVEEPLAVVTHIGIAVAVGEG